MTHVEIRPILHSDNAAMAAVIRTVMPEFGAGGAGFAIHDPEVDDMTAAYSKTRCAYFVCTVNKAVVGGGGIAPLAGGNDNTCELKKMYFLPAGRGQGWGQNVLLACIDAARAAGFRYCYLETFNTMKGAMKLYERNGFLKIPGPLGNTGHFACDTFYQLDLQQPALAK